jgi:hypothetical protein
MSTILDLRAYRTMVETAMARALSEKKPVILGNTGPAHAAVVLEIMAANSNNTLDIVSGFLDDSVWSADFLQAFLTRNPKSEIRILLDDLPHDRVPDRSALNRLRRSDRLVAKRLPLPLGVHFCVGDGLHIRLEPLPSSCEASVSFGNRELAQRIESSFESMWGKLGTDQILDYGIPEKFDEQSAAVELSM